MSRPPQFNVDFDKLPSDPKERHEILVDLFGQYLFWVRNETSQTIRHRGESCDAREKLGRLFRREFDEIAQLAPEDRQRAYAVAERAIDMFGKLLLTMISGQGFDDTIGPRHVFRYRLDMEICDADTGNVVCEETINRNGEKFFPDYWGRWLNRFSGSESTAAEGQA